jgi:hypothetical protein
MVLVGANRRSSAVAPKTGTEELASVVHPLRTADLSAGGATRVVQSPSMRELTNTLIFFPWIRFDEPVCIGDMRLVPYARGNDAHSEDVHRILARYRTSTGQPVTAATLLEIKGCVGGPVTEQDREAARDLQGMLAFSALGSRRLFDQSAYVNAHHFACIVAPYASGAEGVVTSARRREGENIQWHTDETYQAICPSHVSPETKPEIEQAFLESLIAFSDREEWLQTAVELHNLANTDSPDVRLHTEVILAVAALQPAMAAGGLFKEDLLAPVFVRALSGVQETRTLTDGERAIPAKDIGSPPRSLREIWFRDLYRTRNAFAHGSMHEARPKIWTPEEHLCLASYIVPRLVMLRLSTLGQYTLPDERRDEIGAFDYLLCLPAFKPTKEEQMAGRWPWARCYFEATSKLRSERLIAKYVKDAERPLKGDGGD